MLLTRNESYIADISVALLFYEFNPYRDPVFYDVCVNLHYSNDRASWSCNAKEAQFAVETEVKVESTRSGEPKTTLLKR